MRSRWTRLLVALAAPVGLLVLLADSDGTYSPETYMVSGGGSTVRTHYLRDSVPRTFGWYRVGDGIDSLAVDLTTASEVIATPR